VNCWFTLLEKEVEEAERQEAEWVGGRGAPGKALLNKDELFLGAP
jgi:hypothetical protein